MQRLEMLSFKPWGSCFNKSMKALSREYMSAYVSGETGSVYTTCRLAWPAHLVQGPTQSSLLSLSKGICDSCTILPSPALVDAFETLCPNTIEES